MRNKEQFSVEEQVGNILELKDTITYDTFNFPAFDEDKYLNLERKYPCYFHAKEKSRYIAEVNIALIVGDNWSFESVETRGNYPHISKIINILDAYAGIMHHNNNELPAVPIYKIRDTYFLEEGNHRLYVLKLLRSLGLTNQKTIKCDIFEFDYDSFLKESRIIHDNSTKEYNQILYNPHHHDIMGDIYDVDYISKEDTETFLSLKNSI